MLYLSAKEQVNIEFLEEWEGRKGKFARIFGISDKRNNNGWRATWQSIKEHIKTFIGRPAIVFEKCEKEICDLDHTDGKTYQENLEAQEPYRVTDIIDFVLDEKNHTADFIHEFHDEETFEKVQSGELKFTSPSIWPMQGGWEKVGEMPNGLDEIDVYNWKGLHSAFVTKPAFGPAARVKATCEGEECPVRLLTANNSLVACQCNASHSMNDEERHKMESMKKAMDEKDEEIKKLKSKLSAMDEEDHKKKTEAKKGAEDDEDEDEEKKKPEAKKAKTDLRAAEKDKAFIARVTKLEQAASAPLIAKMVEIRESAGLSEERIEAFKASMDGKGFEEVEKQYNAEMDLHEPLKARSLEAREHYDFPSSEMGALQGKSLEEIFGEVVS